MAPSKTYLSIITTLLSIHYSNAQTGDGCYSKLCPEPGQVRINAIYRNGQFVGGCNCGCDPELGNPASPLFCDTALNFDPVTLRGDCSCIGHGTVSNPQPPNPAQPHPVPVPLLPGTPIEVICGEEPVCQCPSGHVGECTLSCTGSPDACIEAILSCNNDGYKCTLDCSEQAACSGATIFGPRNGPLEVFCSGEEACDQGLTIEHRPGTDLYVMCDGVTACIDAVFNFGAAMSYVECNGDPEACQGAKFNLLPGIRDRVGASFTCVGLFCPEPPLAPLPFDNSGRSRCSSAGDCSCTPGANKPCEIDCNGTPDACKDGIIECNSDGFDCVINCRATNACSGAAQIIAPRGAKLTVNCIGDKSCQGSVTMDGGFTTDMTVSCDGFEACKGNVEINFGYGVSSVACNGNPDSCQGAVFNLIPGAESRPGAAFSCEGAFCPLDAPPAFSNVVSTSSTNAPWPIAASYCCLTSILNYKPWAGRCWDETTQEECLLEPNDRCVWNPNNCLPSPPVNTFVGSGPCAFYQMPCTMNSECCSETCNTNNNQCV